MATKENTRGADCKLLENRELICWKAGQVESFEAGSLDNSQET